MVYGQDVLKAVGTSVATQNFYYEAPDAEDTDRTYYGSYFDEHDVLVQVFLYDKEGEKRILVNDVMKAGEQRELTALSKEMIKEIMGCELTDTGNRPPPGCWP